MKKTKLEDINIGPSVKVIQLSDKHAKQERKNVSEIKMLSKNQINQFYVFNKNSKQTNFNTYSAENKKNFMENISHYMINQKFLLNLPTILEMSKLELNIKKDKENDKIELEQENILNTTKNEKNEKLLTPYINQNTLSINDLDELENFKNNNSKFDYINNIDNAKENFRAGNSSVANGKFKRLKKKLKISDLNSEFRFRNFSDQNDKNLDKNSNNNSNNNLNNKTLYGSLLSDLNRINKINQVSISINDYNNNILIQELEETKNFTFNENSGTQSQKNSHVKNYFTRAKIVHRNSSGANIFNINTINNKNNPKNKNISNLYYDLSETITNTPINLKKGLILTKSDHFILPKIEPHTNKNKKYAGISDKARLRHLITKTKFNLK